MVSAPQTTEKFDHPAKSPISPCRFRQRGRNIGGLRIRPSVGVVRCGVQGILFSTSRKLLLRTPHFVRRRRCESTSDSEFRAFKVAKGWLSVMCGAEFSGFLSHDSSAARAHASTIFHPAAVAQRHHDRRRLVWESVHGWRQWFHQHLPAGDKSWPMTFGRRFCFCSPGVSLLRSAEIFHGGVTSAFGRSNLRRKSGEREILECRVRPPCG